MPHTIVHFEIPANDPEKVAGFYRSLFGWQIEKTPGEGVEYWLIQTVAEGEHGVNGGIVRRQNPHQPPLNYIGVESVDEYAAKAAALGATLVMPKQAVPGMGFFAVLLDPEGNPVALWEDNAQAS